MEDNELTPLKIPEDEQSNNTYLEELFEQDHTVLGPQILKDSKFDPILTPFEVIWTFGFCVNLPVINLTDGERREIFYTAANVGILYDYCKKTMTHLKGHQHRIVSVGIDRTGRWIATADNGKDNVIMVWDSTDRSVVWTIFNHPGSGHEISLVALSPNAKILITVSNKNGTTIDFWLWTFGKDEPDDSYKSDYHLGKPKAIQFHPNKETHFMVVFEKEVLFFTWDYEQKKASEPKILKDSNHSSKYTDGTYVDCCHECFVSTSRGEIVVFGNTIFTKPFQNKENIDNKKICIKRIKTSRGSINCITSIDEIIVTGDVNGSIMFFDKTLKLLYWFTKMVTTPIQSVSFWRCPRLYKIVDIAPDGTNLEVKNSKIIPDCQDRSEEYHLVMKKMLPKDATLKKNPFLTTDFFISTIDGIIYLCNFLSRKFVPIFSTADSVITAIDIHDEKPYIIIGYSKGRVTIFNYQTHEEVTTTVLPETEENVTITAIKYSPQCLHLACGRSNGELWLLQPTLLSQIYVDPFKFSDKKVVKIVFSKNSLQMAYYDDNMTVFGFYYDTESEDWMFKGKVRSHYKEICNILFLDEPPYGLYSVGKDRNIIKYTDLAPDEDELDISVRDRIEQKDIPIYFISYFKGKFSKTGYFVTVDDKHKYKKVNVKTYMCTGVYLGPAYGCYHNSPVTKIEFIPKCNMRYLIFSNKKHIGIQLMPIDGNPYKFIGCLGHPEEVLDFKISPCGSFLFTISKNDRTVFMWKINHTSVDKMYQLGGLELQPFYCLLEGGRGGFLYQEMKDLFYYMQILQQGEQIHLPRVVSNSINIGELPDLMRACGYYPSEYEIENLLTDVRYKHFDDTGLLKDKATFCDFVKLFINHKPAYGYLLEKLEDSFQTITTFSDMYGGRDMPRDDFIEAITTTGEQVSSEQIYRCLTTLLHEEVEEEPTGERDFGFLEENVDFDYLSEEILGLDISTFEKKSDSFDYGSY